MQFTFAKCPPFFKIKVLCCLLLPQNTNNNNIIILATNVEEKNVLYSTEYRVEEVQANPVRLLFKKPLFAKSKSTPVSQCQ